MQADTTMGEGAALADPGDGRTALVPDGLLPSGRSVVVLGMRVDELSFATAMNQIRLWAHGGERRYVCVSTVHMIMECHDNPAYRALVNDADLVCADGMPVNWASRLLGLREQTRVPGPELTFRLCEMAAACGIPVGFYGSTPETIDALQASLHARLPRLDIAYAVSPPFRPLSDAENAAAADAINRSGARILFVGLGCPKQERWMHQARQRVNAVALGVGYAFDIQSGLATRAPDWLQRIGLEWMYRMFQDPGKLMKRYMTTNPRFLYSLALQLLGVRRHAQ